ncbi:hypothetical protein L5515_005242 [Caenorhabditis briggsae]|uniref:Sdz-33 F-box domain-containing protein n=2 Tax=Caenorhabditis briggsae TaxID=6238 RepID=A0AAE9EPZ0_CAEBR|nr:hypothetical protein L5515_005242 [Caenorhabditis briggsae]
MSFYTFFAFFAILAVASVSGHRCRGSSYGGGGRGGRGGAIVIGSNNPNKIDLSLCSKRSKTLISRNFWRHLDVSCYLEFSENIELQLNIPHHLINIKFVIDQEQPTPRNIENVTQIKVRQNHSTLFKLIPKRDDFKVGEWIAHFMDIFHANTERSRIHFRPSWQYLELYSVRDLLKGINRVRFTFGTAGNPAFIRKALEILPPARQYVISSHCCLDNDTRQRFLTRNLSWLGFDPNALWRSFENILITNAQYINADKSSIRLEWMNRFLKMWIKGSNRRLKYLRIGVAHLYKVGVLMKGIRYQEMRERRQFNIIHVYTAANVPVFISKGIEIHRSDGKATATLNIRNDDILEMFVTD